MQCNALKIKTATRPGYAGTTTNLQLVLNTQKTPYLNLATPKNSCEILLPKKIMESKISIPPQKNPSIIHVTCSPEYLPLRVNQRVRCLC